MIKAVLFDFDGTLADTNPLIIRTFDETFSMLLPERPLTMAEILACVGPTLDETGNKYFPDNPQKFVDTYREINARYHDDMIEIYPGVLDLIATLKEKGLKLAIVSSKRRDFVIRGLKCVGLFDYFDYIVACDDVKNPKPDVEPFEKVMNYYGIEPHECLMVGDNSHDVHGAQNAKIKSVAVGWAFKGRAYLESLAPDYIIDEAQDLIQIVEEN